MQTSFAVVMASLAIGALAAPQPTSTTIAARDATSTTVAARDATSTIVAARQDASTTIAARQDTSTTVAARQATTTVAPAARDIQRRFDAPASSGSSALSDVYTVAAGESFDGGMYVYDRGVECTGQDEGGDSDAVFQIEEGGTLSNVIIGPNQIEGVHCQGGCTLSNVWWTAVCEDAFTVKKQDSGDTTYIKGGGAYGADDKVLQHNGGGTISVSDFVVEDFGKLYRSCGNCDSMYERHIILDGVTATSGKEICGINSNYGDSCTISNITSDDIDDVCVTYTGTDDNDEEPSENSDNGDGCDGTFCVC